MSGSVNRGFLNKTLVKSHSALTSDHCCPCDNTLWPLVVGACDVTPPATLSLAFMTWSRTHHRYPITTYHNYTTLSVTTATWSWAGAGIPELSPRQVPMVSVRLASAVLPNVAPHQAFAVITHTLSSSTAATATTATSRQ